MKSLLVHLVLLSALIPFSAFGQDTDGGDNPPEDPCGDGTGEYTYTDACGNGSCDAADDGACPCIDGSYPYSDACGNDTCDAAMDGEYPIDCDGDDIGDVCSQDECLPCENGTADYAYDCDPNIAVSS